MKVGKLLALFVIVIAESTWAQAQSAPDLENGFKAYGSYDGSNIDSVNLMNGNLMLHIPLPSTYPQRGGALNPKSLLTVSSKQWSVQCNTLAGSGLNCYWSLGTGMGALVAAAGSGVGFDDTMDLAVHRTTISNAEQGGMTTYASWVDSVNTSDGAQHPMTPTPTSAKDPNGNNISYESVDTTGFHVDLGGFDPETGQPTTGVLTTRHGTRYQFNSWGGACSTVTGGGSGPNGGAETITITCNIASHAANMTDANGNVIVLNQGVGQGPVIDTMGRSFTAGYFTSGAQTSDPTGCVLNGEPFQSATIFNYPGPGGASQQIKACYATVPISTAFGQSGVKEAQSAPQPLTSMPVLTTVILPDQSTWVFQYDSYADVTYVGLPNGGSISYVWQTVSITPECGSSALFSRAVSSRIINDNNGHSFIWNYHWGTLSNGTLTNTATDALNNDTVHTFTAINGECQALYETTNQVYQGTGGARTPLKQTVTVYSGQSFPTGSSGAEGNVVPKSIQTTIYPSGTVSLITRSYDSGLGANAPIFGNVTTEKEYDWGQSTLLRETDTTYQWQNDSRYLTAHLLDLPATVIVRDGSGCALSETDYTYDESSYMTSYEGTVGALPSGTHVAAPNPVSGNLTTVTKWLAPAGSCNPKGGTAVVSHTNWYNTGEAHQQIDPLLRATTHSYDLAYAGAYSTMTCSPTTNGGATTHCVSGTYDFTTGLLTSFTNENATQQALGNTPGDSGHTSSYTYDLMGRLTAATAPPDANNNNAQAVTQFIYPVPITLPFAVTRTRSITTGQTDSITTTYDGLGRVYKTQHPLPNGTAEVDTEYDGLDHVISVTNPYFSTSDPTYGITQTAYDALGRATQVTEQDNSVRSVSYSQGACANGDDTTTADEAGNARRTCADALGRLVEVDEPQSFLLPTNATGSVTISGALQGGATPPAAAAGSPLISFADASGGQHWAYFDVNQHLYNLFWTPSSGYGFFDATAETGAPTAASGSALAGFGDLNGGLHWAYFDSNGHVYNLWWNSGNSRGVADVTAVSGAPAAVAGSALGAFEDTNGGQHWAYFGSNQHVYNLYWNSSGYGTASDVTADAGAPAAASGSGLAAFADTNGGQHWAYLGTNQDLYDLGWTPGVGYALGGDVTATTSAPAAVAGSAVAGFGDSSGGLHWSYFNGSRHIYNLYRNPCCGYGNGGDVTAAVGAPAAVSGSALAGFADSDGSQFWSYLGSNGHVYDLYWTSSGGYSYQDVNAVSGAPAAGSSGLVSGFSNWSGGQEHWDYLGWNQHVYQIYGTNVGAGYADINASTSTALDAGVVTLNVGGYNATACFGPSSNPSCSGQPVNSTASQVAAALAQAINAGGSPASATASGAGINIVWKTPGGSAPSIAALATTHDNGALYPNPSFTSPAVTMSPGSETSLDGGYVTFYSYDGLGDLLQVNQKGDGSQSARVRSFTYDTLGRLLTATNPESGTISYSYDANGNVLQKTSPQANQTGSATQIVSYCYDELNRPTGKAYSAQSCQGTQLPNGTAVVSYVYDQGANAKGKLTSLADQAGSAAYAYDVLGRMATEQRVLAGVTKNMSYGYNLDGSLKTVTYPSGASVAYAVDSAGRDVSAVDSGNGINYATAASYDAAGDLTGFVSGNSGSFAGITNSFSFNKRLQPVNMSASAPSQTVFSLGYDFHFANGDNGNVFGITNYKDNSRNQSFTYDSLNRLTSAQNAGTNCSAMTANAKTEYWGNTYGYDAWGNLLAKTVTKCSAESLSVTADANNHLQGGYTYDAAGNMLHDATSGWNYTYDQENRITGAAGYTYTYDGDGSRVEKSNGSTGTLYWYMSPGIVAESDLGGNLQSEYVFFDGERVARKDFPGLAVSYYFSDHLKTTDIVTDASGNIKNESDFYPWGGELEFLANDSNHYKFTGKERDSETGLDYFGARYYSNGLGRFITPDWAAKATAVPYAEFADPQSLNLYSYVRNLPTSHVDADGHCCEIPEAVQGQIDIGVLKGIGNFFIKWDNGIRDALNKIGAHYKPISELKPSNKIQAAAMPAGETVGMAIVVMGGGAKDGGAVEPYEVGTFGELSSRSVGDGLSIDHIPSNASNVARAAAAKGEALTPAEANEVRDQGMAVAVPDAAHRSASPTYGGRNTQAQIQSDAADPQAAVQRDTDAMIDAARPAHRSKARKAADQLRKAAQGGGK